MDDLCRHEKGTGLGACYKTRRAEFKRGGDGDGDNDSGDGSGGCNDGAGGSGDGGNNMTTFDQLLDHLGTGSWSFFYYSVLAIYMACFGISVMSAGFIAPVMDYTCRLPSAPILTNSTTTGSTFHSTSSFAYNSTFTITPIDRCAYWVNVSDGAGWQEKCTQWDFDHSTFGNTLTSEMLLVCDRSFFVPLYQSVFMFGSGVGAAVGGVLSDRFGRRPVFVWSCMVFVVGTAAATLLPNIITLILVVRSILGFLLLASLSAGHTLVMETTRRVVRPVAGMMVTFPWSLGVVVYGGLGYVIRDWRNLQLASTLPFLLCFPALWWLGESPRWLLVRGEVEAANEEVNRAVRWHRALPPPPNTLNIISQQLRGKQDDDAARSKRSIFTWLNQQTLQLLILFRTRKLCVLTMVVSLDFFVCSMVYYSLSLNAVNFSADPYVYMTLSGVVGFPSHFLTGPILVRVGRKIPAIACFWLTALCMLALPFMPTDSHWAKMVVGLLGRMFIDSVFMELYLYSSEVFPTEVRQQGLGTGVFASRLGSLLSPFFNDILVPLYPWMTPVVFSVLSVLSGCATFLLPETRDANMPDITDQFNRNTTNTPTQEEENTGLRIAIGTGELEATFPPTPDKSIVTVTRTAVCVPQDEKQQDRAKRVMRIFGRVESIAQITRSPPRHVTDTQLTRRP